MTSRAFTAGMQAYNEGLSRGSNPYAPDTDEYVDWFAGYDWAEEQQWLDEVIG